MTAATAYNRPMSGKYRTRTWLRGHTPSAVTGFFPKGNDCGAHEWYRHDESMDACYHCVQTRAHLTQPIASSELENLQRAAQAGSRAALDILSRLIEDGSVIVVSRDAAVPPAQVRA